ncbi:MAG: DUF3160 domain-containing protein [Ignavibacteriaceae bacterium]|nr:DUF3160 domain-containing protein [Ignavibacteriaceae bacterium]
MKIKISFLALLLWSVSLFSQTSQFNINEYKLFLQQNASITPDQLLQMHSAGVFESNINLPTNDALYYDSIKAIYSLTNTEENLIASHGFMVSERLKFDSFGKAFLDIYHKDLPVIVTTDAILQAFHISYDRVLKNMEIGELVDDVESILNGAHLFMPQLDALYSANPEMLPMLKDVDVYVTVGRKLMGETASPYYASNIPFIDSLIQLIMDADGIGTLELFSSNCRSYDWSQFKPRGHYVDPFYPELKNYWRTMIWYGRMEIYLGKPKANDPFCEPQTPADIKRQVIDAFLIQQLIQISGVRNKVDGVEEMIKFFVGEQDNVTLTNLDFLQNAISLNTPADLLNDTKLEEFHDSLSNQSFAYQLIMSQLLASEPMSPDSITPASAFLLFGQRFVVDSYVMSQVVYDRVACRLFPSSLDPLFALGNNAALQLLQPELQTYNYSPILAGLRYLFDNYPDDYWKSSLYNAWVGSIRQLNPPEDRTMLPQFMTTAAFWQEKLNTQLFSWAQLRHDNLLYAKQSYTGIPICSYPYGYVEPFPEFYESLKTFSIIAKNKFSTFNFSDPYYKQMLIDYYNNFASVMDTLKSISEKELSGTLLSFEEINFLKGIVYEGSSGCAPGYDGWYPSLFFDDAGYMFQGLMEKENVVADVHTTPADCAGNTHGWITHVGTGFVNLGVFITNVPSGEKVAFVGPLNSYYEYVTDNFLRLTDDEWSATYLQSAARPSWVNLYLADSTGNTRGEGATLITGVKRDDNTVIPESEIVLNNYPNPFNPSTIIHFTVPYDRSNKLVKLSIYNIQGELVETLINGNLSSGSYVTKWNAKNFASGIYICSVNVGDKNKTIKLTLVK